MGEQARRDLRLGAGDLRGGEECGHGEVERLLAGVRSGGTGLIGQQLRRHGQSCGVGGVVGQCRLRCLTEHGSDGGNGVLALDLPHTVRNAGGIGDGIERSALFGGAQDDIHDGRGLVGERHGAPLHLELGDRVRGGGHVSAGIALAARKYTHRANRHNARHAPRLTRAFVHVIRRTRILEHEPVGDGTAQGVVAAQDTAHLRQRFEYAILSWADAGKRKSFHGRS